MPALARIIEELPAAVPAVAVVEVSDEDDLGYLPVRDNVSVVRAVGGNGAGPSTLADLIAAQRFPDGDGYLWFAGEAAQSRAVRKWLRGELGWASAQFDIVGYWRQGSEEWDQRFAEVGQDMLAVYRQALADGKSQKDALEEYDNALERAGL
ncbi:siderophore-interacting protein [Jongsikchunia kroppenstedtii]|uniref:siderophore-interacting protein n=1 Tax=Jongsikchunia kroppenstedtii TaxID=1121721 RepID=UPI00036CF6C8|nr:siderophore-interacting protein [Jongsikchunia kroppenstedtii]